MVGGGRHFNPQHGEETDPERQMQATRPPKRMAGRALAWSREQTSGRPAADVGPGAWRMAQDTGGLDTDLSPPVSRNHRRVLRKELKEGSSKPLFQAICEILFIWSSCFPSSQELNWQESSIHLPQCHEEGGSGDHAPLS